MKRTLAVIPVLLLAHDVARAQADAELPFVVTAHTVPAGDVMLETRYYAPKDAAGPVPVIVMVPGSGFLDSTQDPYTRLLVDVWSRAGIGVMTYNKRGNGRSTGTYSDTRFDEGARDVSAVVDYTAMLHGVDKDFIGLWGLSQAGWVMPKTAAMNAHVRFLVMVSPPGVSPAEQVGFYFRCELRGLGLTEAEAEEGEALWETVLRYYATGEGYPEAQEAVAVAFEEPWFAKVVKHPFWHDMSGPGEIYSPERLAAEIARRPEDFEFYRAPTTLADYGRDYRGIRLPTLVIYGGRDTIIPAARSREVLEEEFRQGHLEDVQFRVFPEGDHPIQINEHEVAPGYRELIRDWVLEHRSPR